MKPVFEHSCGVLYNGDALAVLRELPEASVHCCVTSPPYWGLRDYGTAKWEGGRPDCDHVYNHGAQGKSGERADRTFTAQAVYRDECRKCGAVRVDQQLGLERTPEEYVSRMVGIFREVRRVLDPAGTLWLNIGDSYCSDAGRDRAPLGVCAAPGLKPKDLVGIPWMLAFALRADGWYLRSEIIWAKPNPKPESVQDRPTKAHETIFLLAKSQRYFYDAKAIAEPTHGTFSAAVKDLVDSRNKRSVWTVATEPFPEAHFATFPQALIRPCILAGCPEGGTVLDPFSGAGTTALVAKENGRRFIGIELSPDYCRMSAKRLAQEVLPLGTANESPEAEPGAPEVKQEALKPPRQLKSLPQ